MLNELFQHQFAVAMQLCSSMINIASQISYGNGEADNSEVTNCEKKINFLYNKSTNEKGLKKNEAF
jgi:hypothetical protein